jgi:hypothetical protein
VRRIEGHHRRRIARRLEWTFDIVEYVERFELPLANLPSVHFNVDTINDEAIERAAEAVRDSWALGRGPITDLPPILEKNGIVLVCEAVDCDDMDAVSCFVANSASSGVLA